jgi:uncharacterized metal-binding protein YceD (DUF177 family)
MDAHFKIYIDRLRFGKEEEIREVYKPDFLEIQEEELAFVGNVTLDGKVYIATDDLVLHWNISASALMPCAICGADVPIDIKIDNFYHSEPLDDIKSGIFDFKELLRETILLEVPQLAECGGNCPSRKEISRFLKSGQKINGEENGPEEDGGHKPFANIL